MGLRNHGLSILLTGSVLLVSCAPARQNYQMAFVPAAAPAAANPAPTPLEPPAVVLNLYLSSETPKFLMEQPRLPARPTPSDLLLAKAEESFQQGRRVYQTGDREGARKQIGRAHV